MFVTYQRGPDTVVEVLIGRMLVNHMPPLHRLSDVVVKNIKHKYYAEMSQKSEVVSSRYNYVHV